MLKLSRLLFAVAVTVAGIGCGGGGVNLPVVPATGKATFNGEPLIGATIILSPREGSVVATATTDPEGGFEIVTGEQVGALPGIYQVLVTKYDYVADPNADSEHQEPELTGKLVTPKKYMLKETTDLELTIPDQGSSTLEISLTGGPAAKQS